MKNGDAGMVKMIPTKSIVVETCSNAKTEGLWAVLEEESGEPLNNLMNSWTKQKCWFIG